MKLSKLIKSRLSLLNQIVLNCRKYLLAFHKFLKKEQNKYWVPIPSASTSPLASIPILEPISIFTNIIYIVFNKNNWYKDFI